MQEIFISYSRKDETFGRKLHEGLTQAGHKPWMDWVDIPPSSHWWKEIQAGIDASAIFVFVISPDSLASPVCHLEIAHARTRNKRIIPILYRETDEKEAFKRIEERELGMYLETLIVKEECIALANANWIQLAEINWILFTKPSEYDQKLQTLVQAIETDLDYVKDHTRLQVRSMEWEQGNRQDDFLLRGMDLNHAQEWLIKASGNLQPSPTSLQEAFIKASLANVKARRIRLIRAIIASLITIVLLPYIWLSTRFYLDTSDNGDSLVVRAGDPGLKILPGFDFAAIGTDYSLSDIAESYRTEVANENIQGFWLPFNAWGERLYPLLEPSQGGLAYWRTGRHDQAIAILAEAVSNGDQKAVKTLAYLAFLNPQEISQIVDGLLPSLGSSDEVRQTGLEALEYLRKVSPEGAAFQADRLLHKQYNDPKMQIWAIEASGILSDNPNKALEGIVNLVSSNQRETDQSVTNAFVAILLRGDAIQPTQIDMAIQRVDVLSPDAQNTVLKAILGLELSDEQKGKLNQILEGKLKSGQSKDQIFAMQSLAELNEDVPPTFIQSINRLLSDPDQTVREALPALLMKLSTREPARSFELLEDLALSDSSELVRYRAVQSFQGWLGYDHEIIISTLVQTSGDASDLVRVASLETITNLALETTCCMDEVENVLASKLDDESFDVRMMASQGLLLLSNRVNNPENLSSAAQIFSQAIAIPSMDSRDAAAILAARYTNPEAIITTGEILLPYLRDSDSLGIYESTSFFTNAVNEQPQAIPEISILFSSLLQNDELRGDVLFFIWGIHDQHPNVRSQTLSAFMNLLHIGDTEEQLNGIQVLGILGTQDHEIAFQALEAIEPFQNNPDLNLKVTAFETMGSIGDKYPDLVSKYLPDLVDCVRENSGALQLGCSQALLDCVGGEDIHDSQLAGEVYGLLQISTLESDTRISLAKTLVSISSANNESLQMNGDGLLAHIGTEQNSSVKSWLAGVLAAYGDSKTGQVDAAFSTLAEQGRSDILQEREEVVTILRTLASHQPSLGGRVIQALEPIVTDSNQSLRTLAIISIRDIGLTDIQNAQLGLDSLLPALTSQEADARWNAVANGVAPLLVNYPELAKRAVELLDLSYQEAMKDPNPYFSLSEIQDNQILAYEIIAEESPDILWKLITSSSGYERYVGRAAMIQLLKKRPDLISFFQKEVADMQKRCRPQECLSLSLANEMMILLQNPKFMVTLQDEKTDPQLINWLPNEIEVTPLGNKHDPFWNAR